MTRTNARWQRHALIFAVMADGRMENGFGNGCSQVWPMLAGNHGEHHVNCGCAPRAGETITINFKKTARGIYFREGF